MFYTVTPAGVDILNRYSDIREQCLIDSMLEPGGAANELTSKLAHTLRMLSGQYDQAARAATSL